MALSLTYRISGYTLPCTTQREGMWLVEGTEYAPALTPRRTVLEIPNRHYEIPQWNDPLSPITVGMSIRMAYPTHEELRAGWDLLVGLLGMGTNAPVPLERHRGGEVEYADAQLVSTTTPDFTSPRNQLDVQLVWNIPGGAWRGPWTEEMVTEGTNRTLAVVQESNRPITDALIRVQGPLSSFSAEDVVSGTGVYWGGGSTPPVASGDWLLIDMGSMQAAVMSSSGSWSVEDGDPVSGALVFIGVGPLALTARRSGEMGTPTSGFTPLVGSGTGSVTVRARKAVA